MSNLKYWSRVFWSWKKSLTCFHSFHCANLKFANPSKCVPVQVSALVLDRKSKTVTRFPRRGFPFVSLQPWRRWFQGWKAVKNKVHKVKERLASGCEFLECRSIQPCRPLFRFVPFHISLLLFSLSPLSSSSKLNPNFPGPSFSPPSSLYTCAFSLSRKIRPLSSVNSVSIFI